MSPAIIERPRPSLGQRLADWSVDIVFWAIIAGWVIHIFVRKPDQQLTAWLIAVAAGLLAAWRLGRRLGFLGAAKD